MTVLFVMRFELKVDDIAEAIKQIDPPSIKGFTGEMDVVVEPHAAQLIRWLDGGL